MADGEGEDVAESGIKVGSVIDGGSVMLGRKNEVASGSETVIRIEPISSCETFCPGM